MSSLHYVYKSLNSKVWYKVVCFVRQLNNDNVQTRFTFQSHLRKQERNRCAFDRAPSDCALMCNLTRQVSVHVHIFCYTLLHYYINNVQPLYCLFRCSKNVLICCKLCLLIQTFICYQFITGCSFMILKQPYILLLLYVSFNAQQGITPLYEAIFILFGRQEPPIGKHQKPKMKK